MAIATREGMTPVGTLVARLILSGDVSAARALAADRRPSLSWSVPEGRAIIGACREACRRGWPVRWQSFFGEVAP